MSAGSIAFAETAAQVDALLAQRSRERLEIIAVSPAADFRLEQAGRPGPALEDFYPESRLHADGQANIRRAEALCDWLDDWLACCAPGLPALRYVSFRAYFHPLKGVLDGLSFRGRPLGAALKRLRPRRLLAFVQPPYMYGGFGLLDKPPVSLTSRLAPLIARARGVPVAWLRAGNGYAAAGTVPPRPAFRPTSQRARQPARPLNVIRKRRRGAPPDTPLLLHNLSASFGAALVTCWQRERLGSARTFAETFCRERTRRLRARLRPLGCALWSKLRADAALGGLFSLDAVDVRPLVAPFLERLVCDGLPDLLAHAAIAEEVLRGLPPAAIVTGGMEGRNYVLGRVAAACGVPLVTTHFGGFYGYSRLPMHERYDLAEADYFIVGGEGCVATLARPAPEAAWNTDTKRARPVALGLPWVDARVLAQRRRARKSNPGEAARGGASGAGAGVGAGFSGGPRRLLYVMSALAGDNHYLGHVYMPEVAYWRMQRRIVETVLAFPAVTLILKPPLLGRYPQLHSPLIDWVAACGLQRVEVLPDRPLTDCLASADAFILDSPSTPLLELAATDRPLLVYLERATFRVVPAAVALLKRRAVVADNLPAFLAALRTFLAGSGQGGSGPAGSGRSGARPLDDAFLRAYATHRNDGRSAQRCARFLRQIALDSACPARSRPMRKVGRMVQGRSA